MGSYIKAKSVNTNPNNVKDLEGISKELWHFLSAVYKLHWDGLYTDNFNTLFRNKIKSKFNPQVLKTPASNKDKEIVKPTYSSPLPPPIPAKTLKEVNEVSKYFTKFNVPQKKLYVQTSSKSPNLSSLNAIMNTLKIKKIFPKLQNKKIDQVQKITNGNNSKPKPQINMTTKGLSCKQIIVPMSKEAANKYIKDVSAHIISINSTLKSIKSGIIADFI